MEVIISSILPVAITIIIGALLKNTSLFTEDMWSGIQKLAYYVLFPALIIDTLITADFNDIPILSLVILLSLVIILYSGIILLFYKPIMKSLKLDGPSFSSFFQSCTRWHTFACLAIIQGYFGNEGTAIASIAVATLIPILNIINVPVVVLFSGKTDIKKSYLLMLIAKNPFLLACIIGILINISNIPLHQIIYSSVEVISNGALGVGLLVVGSAINFNDAKNSKNVLIIASILKLIILPAIMAFGCFVFDIHGLTRDIIIICGAIPTASAGVILAKQLGGNHKMVANILSFQLLISLITLPVILLLLQ